MTKRALCLCQHGKGCSEGVKLMLEEMHLEDWEIQSGAIEEGRSNSRSQSYIYNSDLIIVPQGGTATERVKQEFDERFGQDERERLHREGKLIYVTLSTTMQDVQQKVRSAIEKQK